MSSLFFALVLSSFHLDIIGVSNAVVNKEKWGYVNVRPNAYMFWWLHYTHRLDYWSRPLVLWIQGGPGSSGTGIGNFLEIGPYDENLQPRENTWLTKANLLFVDNPVGTGFSYVTDNSSLVVNNAQIARDLLTALSSILQEVPEFQKSPFYIVSESYGGKMTVDFALLLDSAIASKNIQCNFKGISLGDSWISPRDHVTSWGKYLYSLSLLDDTELAKVEYFLHKIIQNIDNNRYREAGEQYPEFSDLIDKFTRDSDWYNFLKTQEPADNGCSRKRGIDDNVLAKLEEKMNNQIRRKLGIIPDNVIWKSESGVVFEFLRGDFMKDVVSSVDDILINHGHLQVNVYNGQLDTIVPTLGVLQWIKKLKWSGLSEFVVVPKQPMILSGNRTAGFVKSYKQFNFFFILDAGHFIPSDVPEAALMMLDNILSKKCSQLFCP